MTSPSRKKAQQHPADTLRAIARELEAELEVVRAELSKNEKGAQEHEVRAMAAVKRGDDRSARAALMEMKVFATEMGELGADAHVLQSLLAEIHEFLAQHASSGAARPVASSEPAN